MLQVQILAVLLSLILVYFLFFGFRFDNMVYSVCHGSPSSLANRNYTCKHTLQNYCGDYTVLNLKFPFRFQDDPSFCIYPEFELSCLHNRTVIPSNDFPTEYPRIPSNDSPTEYYFVDSIDYENQRIRVIDPGVQKDDCSTLPINSPKYPYGTYVQTANSGPSLSMVMGNNPIDELVFVSCKNPVKSKSRFPLYVDTDSCNISANHFSKNNSDQSSSYNYVVVGSKLVASDIEESCTINKIVLAQIDESLLNKTGGDINISFHEIHNLLAHGFQLSWDWTDYRTDLTPMKQFFCSLLSKVNSILVDINSSIRQYYARTGVSVRSIVKFLVLVMAARNVIGISLLMAFLIYKWHRRHLSMYDTIEEFLQANSSSLMPIRYSYREIKAMTKNFKEKLGEGGYALVYKGKLRSGNLVAVKMLNKSKGNGQDFINEVATMGRIHHVNVLRLVGFCVTASNRALVYDYMPNGSLDKFIYSSSPNGTSLSWKKAYEIAIGVARGIEYLHQGCNMQILHFDIKPHNILLDENFVPKVSDFGLAKLYPLQNSNVVNLSAIRGTLGYMAPELFYKKIGRISHKADVYSFGMLLIEMAGRRRDDADRERSSQIYFPSWIYDKIELGEYMEIGDHATDEENAIARRLILIALWCIQMMPNDRPSMRKVLEMLEGDREGIQLPPKPLFHPPDSPIHMQSSYSSCQESTWPRYVTLEIE